MRLSIFAPLLLLLITPISHAAVSAGGMAVIGFNDDLDQVSLAALQDIQAGEVIYLTNNGWHSGLGQFNGAATDQGAGNESLLKLTATATITAGTVIQSTADGASWAWTKTGLIPGQVGGTAEFSDLALDFQADQIYLFQAGDSNPLVSPSSFIYAMHFGNVDYPIFSDLDDLLTGNVPPGLTAGSYYAHTSLTMHGDADGNHAAWGLNLSQSTIAAMQASGATVAQWRTAIANSAHWGAGQPTVPFLNLSPLSLSPEPSRALLLGIGLGGLALRRRRR
jgi:hypothetical protein